MKKLSLTAAAVLLAGAVALGGGSLAPAAAAEAAGSSGVAIPAVGVKTSTLNATQDGVRIVAAVPEFSGFRGAADVNRQIGLRVRNDISYLKEMTAYDAGGSIEASPLYYATGTDYSVHGSGILSAWTYFSEYMGGAHGVSGIVARTVDLKTGKFYEKPSFLFKNRQAGTKWLSEQIIDRINIREASGNSTFYPGVQDTVRQAGDELKFYLDGDNLVVYFDEYEIAPYSEGIPTFVFPLKDIPASLPLTIPAVTGVSGHGEVSVGGSPVTMKHAPSMSGETLYLPLEETASLLGKQAVLTGGVWSVNGRAASTQTINGTVCAPLSYFADTLGEVALYDGSRLHLYPRDTDYEMPAGKAPTYLSDTTQDVSVNGSYTFRITSAGGEMPAFTVGTSGVFLSGLVGKAGSDYFFRITAVGKPGQSAGIYINGEKRLVKATVKTSVASVLCDTEKPFTVKAGQCYQFLLTAPKDPKFVCGNGNVFEVTYSGNNGVGDFYYTAKAIGKPGQSAGFYINGEKTPRVVATVK